MSKHEQKKNNNNKTEKKTKRGKPSVNYSDDFVFDLS